jgi:ATP-dependent DNA helicase RecG
MTIAAFTDTSGEEASSLRNLMASGESEVVEFKKSTAEKEKAFRTICAFANGQGGSLVFGVAPSGKWVGQAVTDRTLEELAQEFHFFEPAVSVQMHRVPIPDSGSPAREALVVRVERGARVPVCFRGVPYERVLNTTRVMPRAVYERLLLESVHARERWEIQAAGGCGLEDLDLRELVVTVEEAIRRGRLVDPGTRDAMALLRGLGLLLPDGGMSCAAVVLFCKEDEILSAFPQLQVRLARFKGRSREEFLDNRQYSGNAFSLMRRAERFLLDWLPIAGRIVSGELARRDTPALPLEAVREALANAFVHRDYSNASGAVSVALYDDRLEIVSPGELHFGLTPEMLYEPHESKPWNPSIAKIFYLRGLIETWGRGTLQIAKLMGEAGLPAPELRTGGGSVSLTFAVRGMPATEKSSEKGSEKSSEKSSEKGSEKSSEKILEILKRNPGFSAKAISEELNMTSRAVEKQMGLLKKAGRLRRMGPAKGGFWKVE